MLYEVITDKLDFQPKAVMMIDIFQPAVAVMTGGYKNLRTADLSGKQLFGLNAVAVNARHFIRRPAVDNTAAGTAAVIVLAVGVHFHQFFTDSIVITSYSIHYTKLYEWSFAH